MTQGDIPKPLGILPGQGMDIDKLRRFLGTGLRARQIVPVHIMDSPGLAGGVLYF